MSKTIVIIPFAHIVILYIDNYHFTHWTELLQVHFPFPWWHVWLGVWRGGFCVYVCVLFYFFSRDPKTDSYSLLGPLRYPVIVCHFILLVYMYLYLHLKHFGIEINLKLDTVGLEGNQTTTKLCVHTNKALIAKIYYFELLPSLILRCAILLFEVISSHYLSQIKIISWPKV